MLWKLFIEPLLLISSALECYTDTNLSLRATCTVLMTHHSAGAFGTVAPASIGHLDIACILEEEAEATIAATIGAAHCGIIIIPLVLCVSVLGGGI